MGNLPPRDDQRNPLIAGLVQLIGDAIVQAAQRPDVAGAIRKVLAVTETAPAEDPDRLLSKVDLAAKLSCSPSTVDRLVRTGMPIACMVGDARRFDLAQCTAWLSTRPHTLRARGKRSSAT
jgi:hypothetical protein